jgi:hypothetical protein
MRILITASRTWTDGQAIFNDLDTEWDRRPPGEPFVVVHGGAAGGDTLASRWAQYRAEAGFPVVEEIHLADWAGQGRKAGILRNLKMVRSDIDLCLAYIYDNSRGATHCATAAHADGIETRITRFDSNA